MEAVPPDTVFLIILIGECVQIGFLGHCLMKGSIEYCDLRNSRHESHTGLNPSYVGRHVQRTQFDNGLKGFNLFLSQQCRFRKKLLAVENPMANCSDL